MKSITLRSEGEVGEKAASLILDGLKRKQNLVLGLATGSTMLPLYENLVSRYEKGGADFSKIRAFSLDEYVGLGEGDEHSFRSFLERYFFQRIGIIGGNIHFLDGKSRNLVKMCSDYEAEIKDAGGIDIQLLGVGRNGHIGFNEPGSSFKSRTRKVKLSEATRRDNARFFDSIKEVPEFAVTMGIGTIMKAKKIILLAAGRNKADAVANALMEPPRESAPASVLQRHKDAVFIIDNLAGSKISKRKE